MKAGYYKGKRLIGVQKQEKYSFSNQKLCVSLPIIFLSKTQIHRGLNSKFFTFFVSILHVKSLKRYIYVEHKVRTSLPNLQRCISDMDFALIEITYEIIYS